MNALDVAVAHLAARQRNLIRRGHARAFGMTPRHSFHSGVHDMRRSCRALVRLPAGWRMPFTGADVRDRPDDVVGELAVGA